MWNYGSKIESQVLSTCVDNLITVIQALMKNIQKTRSTTKQLSLKKISLLQLSQLSAARGGLQLKEDASSKWTKVDPNI
ncbi:MAG: hypothetical protein Tsb0020_30090 [Haliangiales bacterium]